MQQNFNFLLNSLRAQNESTAGQLGQQKDTVRSVETLPSLRALGGDCGHESVGSESEFRS